MFETTVKLFKWMDFYLILFSLLSYNVHSILVIYWKTYKAAHSKKTLEKRMKNKLMVQIKRQNILKMQYYNDNTTRFI